jgi:glycosyltransferase involved in cell wall biosynthesis
MNSLSVIILSYTMDESVYKMNCECIESLFQSEVWSENLSLEVLLIESNKQNPYQYREDVKIIIPNEAFNFHRFLNIGINQSDGKFLALCNNDIIFHKGWFSEILKVKSQRNDFLSFSPVDRDYETMSLSKFPADKNFYIGWENKLHFAAWCFVVDRDIFKVIGKLDETFDFYSADDDFLMTLRKYAINNVLVVHSQVKHLSQQVTKKVNEKKSPKILDKEKYPIPEKYLKRGHEWLWEDIRFYDAFFRMDKKWGDDKMIRRINRFLDKFPILRIRLITKILYAKTTNIILSKLTGIY